MKKLLARLMPKRLPAGPAGKMYPAGHIIFKADDEAGKWCAFIRAPEHDRPFGEKDQ